MQGVLTAMLRQVYTRVLRAQVRLVRVLECSQTLGPFVQPGEVSTVIGNSDKSE